MYKYLVLTVAIIYIYGVRSQYENLPVNQSCLGCICEAMSGCNVTSICQGDVCGPFRITWPYWADAGKPTVKNESPDSATAYKNCALDTFCSALALQGYIKKFSRDCDNNGKIDCDDFLAIHALGPYGCSGLLRDEFDQRYKQCKKLVGGLGN